MLLPKDEIIADITARIQNLGGDLADWYVGVAKDNREPFFEAHLLEDKNDGFLYREAFTPGCAQEIRDYFTTQRGVSVDPSSGVAGRLVYAYRKYPLEPCVRIKKGSFALAR